MTQSTPEDSDKKEAASFFKNWMNCDERKGLKAENWDEVCLQWCKQNDKARKDQVDPNCTMYCFRRPVLKSSGEENLDSKKSWNPLTGYSIVVVNGKEECVTHVDDMNSYKEHNAESIVTEKSIAPSRYEIDLGNLWTEARVGAKYVFDEKISPLYNSTIEQAKEWRKSPEAEKVRDFAKQQADKLYSQVFQTSPPSVNGSKPPSSDPLPNIKPDDLNK